MEITVNNTKLGFLKLIIERYSLNMLIKLKFNKKVETNGNFSFISLKMNIQYNNNSHISKSDLIEKMADELSLSRNKVKQVLNVFIESVQNEVAQGKKVSLIGFGSFSAIYQNERVGMNPKTGEKVNIPSKTIPKFKAGKDFREIVNKKN